MKARRISRSGVRSSLHTGGLGCESVTHSRNAPSSPRVQPAPERARCTRDSHHGLLSPLPHWLDAAVTPLVIRALAAWERLESGVSYNPLSEATRANPYPAYDELRRKDPVHRFRLMKGTWIISRFEDVDAVLRDHHHFTNTGTSHEYIPYRSLLDLHPPDHTRIRRLLSKGFTPRAVTALEPRIRRTVDQLLDDLEDRKRLDLIREFAYPLPVIVIAEMLGVPPEDRELFHRWSKVVSLLVDPLLTASQARRVRKTIEELFEYFDGIIADRRKRPRDDLISSLATAEEEAGKLSRDELLMTLVLLLVAGNETTRNLIGNGTLALLRNRDQLHRLRNDPSLLDSAIEELLRYDSPVQMDARIAVEPATLRGKEISQGDRIICLLGAANRDPAIFPNPDVLDLGRADGKQVAFGRGIHHCLGAPLARLEGRIGFGALLERFGSMSLAAEPRYRKQIVLRGLEELWIDVEWATRR